MRGVIPCYLLAKLEAMLKEKGDDRPFVDHFDLVAGTSTGALIALALTIPLGESGFIQNEEAERKTLFQEMPQSFVDRLLKRKPILEPKGLFPLTPSIQEIGALYQENGKRIFPKRRQSKFFGSLFSEKYDVEPLEEFLKEKFLDTPLSESVVPVMAMAYNIAEEGEPYIFTSRDSHGFRYWEAGRSSSAAPTYFKPAQLTDRVTGERVMLVDGGVVANNPALYAYREARKLYPDCNTFHILSLATKQAGVHVDMNGSTGVMAWIDPSQGAPLQKIYGAAQEQTSSTIIRSIRGLDYVRVEGRLTTRYKLDEVDPQALETLKSDAESMFQNSKEEIERYVEMLAGRTDFDHLKLDTLPPLPTGEHSNALQTATT